MKNTILISERLLRFMSLHNHPFYKKIYVKLNTKERSLCHDFISEHPNLDRNEFATMVARLWMDKKDKPKNWKEMDELLMVCG